VRVPEPRRAALTGTGVVLFACAAYLVNLRGAVDFDLDEVMYAVAGRNVATHGSVSWDARPVAVHPPLHFLLAGLWQATTGTARGPLLEALFAARYLGAAVSILNVALVALLCRLYGRGHRVAAAAAAMATVDGFLVRFGRTALIEPTAILAGLVVVCLAMRLRRAPAPLYIGVVGGASGLALLVKEPLLFTVLAPTLAALLERDRAHLRRTTAAVAVAAGVWTVFPLWAALGGAGSWWLAEHRTNLDRLAGLLQVSGLNRAGVSSTGVFGTTLATYASGYLIFAVGAAGLLRLVWAAGVAHRRPAAPGPALLISFAVLNFGFLAWCVLFGQANEQLTAYTAAPAVLAGVLAWGDPLPRPAIAVCAVLLVAGTAGWAGTVGLARDDATARMGRYLTAHDACAPVNATGDAWRWVPVLPRNPVTAGTDGAALLTSGVHLFLLSRKDSAMRYGVSSPELDAWVRAHGRPVERLGSRRYQTIELWRVPGPVAGPIRPCGNPAAGHAAGASAARFLALLLAALTLLAAGMYGWHRRAAR